MGDLMAAANDLGHLFSSQEKVRRWTAERENATARLDLARADESIFYLLSQHEPLHSLGIDRDALRVLLHYVRHHDKARLTREVAALTTANPEGGNV